LIADNFFILKKTFRSGYNWVKLYFGNSKKIDLICIFHSYNDKIIIIRKIKAE